MSMFGKMFGSKNESDEKLEKAVQIAKACLETGKSMGMNTARPEKEMVDEMSAALASEFKKSPEQVRALFNKQ